MTTPAPPAAPGPVWDRPAEPAPAPPSPWTVPLRVVCGVIAAGLVLLVAFSVVQGFFTRRETSVRTFAAPVERVTVTTDVGDVRVRAGEPGESVRLVARTTAGFASPTWSAAVAGGALDVRSSCDAGWSVIVSSCAADLDLVVPPDTPVRVRSGVGEVRVNGVAAPVDVRTGTGTIRIRDTTGPLTLRSDTGDVDGDALRGDASGQSDTGAVRLRFLAPPTAVRAVAKTGEVLVLVPDDETLYRVSTGSDVGDVHVDVPVATTSPHSITARTDTGDIRLLGR